MCIFLVCITVSNFFPNLCAAFGLSQLSWYDTTPSYSAFFHFLLIYTVFGLLSYCVMQTFAPSCKLSYSSAHTPNNIFALLVRNKTLGGVLPFHSSWRKSRNTKTDKSPYFHTASSWMLQNHLFSASTACFAELLVPIRAPPQIYTLFLWTQCFLHG